MRGRPPRPRISAARPVPSSVSRMVKRLAWTSVRAELTCGSGPHGTRACWSRGERGVGVEHGMDGATDHGAHRRGRSGWTGPFATPGSRHIRPGTRLQPSRAAESGGRGPVLLGGARRSSARSTQETAFGPHGREAAPRGSFQFGLFPTRMQPLATPWTAAAANRVFGVSWTLPATRVLPASRHRSPAPSDNPAVAARPGNEPVHPRRSAKRHSPEAAPAPNSRAADSVR